MSYATWPSTLPSMFMLEGLSGEEPDVNLRQETDIGPAIIRPRYTAASEPISGQILCTTAQKATFTAFYRTTLRRGSLPFVWVDPSDQSSGVFRFKGGFTWQSWNGHWLISFQVEKLPL